jgi:hypothetical protein
MRANPALSILVCVVLAGCDGTDLARGERHTQTRTDDAGVADAATSEPTCREKQKGYVGLGKVELTTKREETAAAMDRARVKPYAVLASEYARTLGKAPPLASAPSTVATFGEVPARWYTEPAATAVGLYTSYRIAFEGCLAQNADPKYAQLPTAETASNECSAWARRFWSRTATPEELAACVKVATADATEEVTQSGSSPTAPQRRWAYTCATVLTSSGFLTY